MMRYLFLLICIFVGTFWSADSFSSDEISFTKLWVKKNMGWNKSLALSDDGILAVRTYSDLKFYRVSDGASLGEVKVCSPVSQGQAMSFLTKETLGLVCEREAIRVHLKNLEIEPIIEWTSAVKTADWNGSSFAVGLESGRLQVIDALKGIAVYDIKTDNPIRALGYHEKTKSIVAALSSRELKLFNLNTQEQKLLPVETSMNPHVIAFHPNGNYVFLSVSSGFSAQLFDLAQTKTVYVFDQGSWLTEAQFISETNFVVSGSEGTLVYGANKKDAMKKVVLNSDAVFPNATVGLAWNDVLKIICTGSRDGHVGCFRQQGEFNLLPLSELKFDELKSSEKIELKKDKENKNNAFKFPAKITKVQGLLLTIGSFDSFNLPIGQKGQLIKKVKTQIMGMDIDADLIIAKVRVTGVDGKNISLVIDEELSKYEVNGQVQSHFEEGLDIVFEVMNE